MSGWREGIVDFTDRHVLMVCGVDRLGMAQVLDALSDHIVFGDLIYGLRLPIRIRSLKGLERVARVIAPSWLICHSIHCIPPAANKKS